MITEIVRNEIENCFVFLDCLSGSSSTFNRRMSTTMREQSTSTDSMRY